MALSSLAAWFFVFVIIVAVAIGISFIVFGSIDLGVLILFIAGILTVYTAIEWPPRTTTRIGQGPVVAPVRQVGARAIPVQQVGMQARAAPAPVQIGTWAAQQAAAQQAATQAAQATVQAIAQQRAAQLQAAGIARTQLAAPVQQAASTQAPVQAIPVQQTASTQVIAGGPRFPVIAAFLPRNATRAGASDRNSDYDSL